MSADPAPQTTPPRYDVFLSYHWRDRESVEALARLLQTHGLRVFLDRWYLHPGRSWPQELEAVFHACGAVAVCVGPGELGPWQQREAYLALERQARAPGFPVIPVLLPGADPVLGFLGQNTWVDLRAAPGDPIPIGILAAAIRGEAPGPDAEQYIAETLAAICPYRGLLYFREEDAPFFFGRAAGIQRLIGAVRRQPLVAAVGASGCGKSSVVRAGLVPALRREREQVWEIVTLVPGAQPLQALASGLLPLLEPGMMETDRLIEGEKMHRALRAGDLHLPAIVGRILQKQTGTDRLLLVVDQWEELYAQTAEEALRRQFIEELLQATAFAPLTAVLTLRGDFVGHALAYRPLADRLEEAQVNLGPMVRAELQEAIEQPAAQVGLRFEAGLVERILDDAGEEPGNLPLLEFVLKELWARRQHGELGHAAYEDIGRLPGAVAKRADALFGRLSGLEQAAVQRVFLALATPTEEGEYTRRRATLAELGAGVEEVVQKLATERLLVMAPGVGASEGEETVEVAHEALLRRWDTLRAWLDEQRGFLLWRKRFGELVAAWRAGEHRGDALATGLFLSEAERWQRERGEALSPEEQQYIAASLARRQREGIEKEAQRQRELEQAQQLADEAEARRVAEAQRAQEAEARARAQRRAKQVALAGMAVLFVIAAGMFYAAGGVNLLTRWVARRALAQELKWVPIRAPAGGVFQMGCVPGDGQCDGDELPRHPVAISRPFELMAYEVTVAQFRRFNDSTGAPAVRWLRPWDVFRETQPPWSEENHPAVNVAWFEAAAFCAFVGGRLPIEAEWEYAARGGSADTIYPWGNYYSQDRANGWGKGGDDRWDHSAPVGSFPANGFGLYDMVGNAGEWTSSVYRNLPYRGEQPGDPESRESRLMRGGSWADTPKFLRVSTRIHIPPTLRDSSLGFRCARDTSP